MKFNKFIIAIILGLSSFAYAKVNAVVSILPQFAFLEAIGGDKVSITLMVKPGSSPHSYEPKPTQMKSIDKADIYFSIGVEFERAWLKKFSNQNANMKIIDVSNGIQKYGKDPHIWTNPDNIKIIAKNMLDALISIDKNNQKFYEKNYKRFINKVDKTDKEIKKILKDVPKGANFMVFHPSWGYFAKKYALTQLPIEIEGKKPKPKTLRYLIEKAKKENVKAIFAQPEFSDKIAKLVARELGIKVIKVSPLNPNWSENLIDLARAIANKQQH